jgi:hypothetical protein
LEKRRYHSADPPWYSALSKEEKKKKKKHLGTYEGGTYTLQYICPSLVRSIK